MGNFLPCLAHGNNVPSNLTKQKLHCYTSLLNRLYKFKPSKDSTSTILSLSRDEQTKNGNQDNKGTIRVKVVLTKKEAVKLLSMSFKQDKTIGQIMAELKKIEENRVKSEHLFGTGNRVWKPVLESIPEDSVPVA